MDSSTKSKIPVIDFKNLKPGSESWILACDKVRNALEEYGCFMIVSDVVSEDLKNEVYANFKTLFDLPAETKMKINDSDKPLRGYLSNSHDSPVFESTWIDHDRIDSFTNLMWPSGNDQFSKTIHSYGSVVSKLESQVRRMLFESYGVEKYHESFDERMSYVLKPNIYRPQKSDETNVDGMHTDRSVFTILSQNQLNGLQIQKKDDDEWIPVEFLPSSFVILAGDACMAWSNGRIKSCRHRVVMNGKEDRYSTGLFTFKKGITEIPKELVDEKHPPKFKPLDHLEFFDSWSKDPRYVDERAVELYCGI